MKTNEEIMAEFVEMVEQDILHEADLKEECLKGWRILLRQPEFQAIKERVESENSAQCSCLGHCFKCQPDDYPALDELKDKVEDEFESTEDNNIQSIINRLQTERDEAIKGLHQLQHNLATGKKDKMEGISLLDFVNQFGGNHNLNTPTETIEMISDYIETHLK